MLSINNVCAAAATAAKDLTQHVHLPAGAVAAASRTGILIADGTSAAARSVHIRIQTSPE